MNCNCLAAHPKGTSCGALHSIGRLAGRSAIQIGMLGDLIVFLWSADE